MDPERVVTFGQRKKKLWQRANASFGQSKRKSGYLRSEKEAMAKG